MHEKTARIFSNDMVRDSIPAESHDFSRVSWRDSVSLWSKRVQTLWFIKVKEIYFFLDKRASVIRKRGREKNLRNSVVHQRM